MAPAGADISDLGVEVVVGALTGLPFEGVLRFGFPWPGFTPCTWLTTLSRDDLIERAGALSSAKLSEIDDTLRAAGRRTEWTPAAAARLSETATRSQTPLVTSQQPDPANFEEPEFPT